MIIYTSGTTGPPKGAMLTHRSILFMAEALHRANPIRADDEGVSYLPFAHVYENLISVFLPLRTGSVVSFVESPETLFANLREVSPDGARRRPARLGEAALGGGARMQDSTWLKRKCLCAGRWGWDGAHARALRIRQEPHRASLALAHRLAIAMVFAPLKRLLGLDRVRLGLCGAAPASPEMFAWYPRARGAAPRGIRPDRVVGRDQREPRGRARVSAPWASRSTASR